MNKEEFLVELSKSSFSSCEVEIDYIIKNYEHTLSEYEELFKNEITKVYEKIKDKKIVYNTVFGKGDCYNVDICFSFNYQLSENNIVYLGSLIMKYGDDNWKESFENCMTEFVLTQEELDEMKKSLNG